MQPAAVYPTGRCPTSTHPLTHGAPGAAGAAGAGPPPAGWLQRQRCVNHISEAILRPERNPSNFRPSLQSRRLAPLPSSSLDIPATFKTLSCPVSTPRVCMCETQPLRSPALPTPWSQRAPPHPTPLPGPKRPPPASLGLFLLVFCLFFWCWVVEASVW